VLRRGRAARERREVAVRLARHGARALARGDEHRVAAEVEEPDRRE
jgi:hypothetical protein